MTKKLTPTGLYSLEDGDGISNELKTYSVGIDELDNSLDVIIREAFIPTAEDVGLKSWEELFGGIQSELSSQARRDLITERLRLCFNDFTLHGVKNIIKSLGITNYTLTEHPSLFLVTVDISSQNYSETQRKWVKEQLEELLPAHLEIDVVFGTTSWNTIDNLGLTADQMDSKNYSWDNIDTMII